MIDVTTYSVQRIKRYDPTRTTTLRNAFAREAVRRFKELKAVIALSVYQNDCFGLKPQIHTFQMRAVPPGAFAFTRSAEKVSAFMLWLNDQVKAGIITVAELEQVGEGVEAMWTNKYILDSYKRGVQRARYEMRKVGIDIPTIEDSGGIDAVMNNIFHIDRVGLLYTRVYKDLKGITDAMDSQISRILAQGMVDGDGPRLLARKLVSTIDGKNAGTLGITDTLGRFIPAQRRAETLARTEIIRAHHLATVQEYRNFGLEGIQVQAEWVTAGDDRVCDECSSLEGKRYTLDEIEPMIPVHPNCRCLAVPYLEEFAKYGYE